jgi:hypothetical protein
MQKQKKLNSLPRAQKFFAKSRRRPLGKQLFAESLTEDPRQRNFLRKYKKEEKPLPRTGSGALGKENAKKTFAESQIGGSRQRK